MIESNESNVYYQVPSPTTVALQTVEEGKVGTLSQGEELGAKPAAASTDKAFVPSGPDEVRKQLDELMALQRKTIKEINVLKQTIIDQNRKIAEQDQKIAEQNQTIAEQNRKIAEQNQTIAEQNQKIAELRQKNDDMLSAICRAVRSRQALDEVDQAGADLAASNPEAYVDYKLVSAFVWLFGGKILPPSYTDLPPPYSN